VLSFRFLGPNVREGCCTEGDGANEENIDACDEPPNDILLAPIEELEEFAERLYHLEGEGKGSELEHNLASLKHNQNPVCALIQHTRPCGRRLADVHTFNLEASAITTRRFYTGTPDF
jgi:hypothetical protein